MLVIDDTKQRNKHSSYTQNWKVERGNKNDAQQSNVPPDPIPHSQQPTGNESSADQTNCVAPSPAGSRAQEHELVTPSQAAWPGAASTLRSPLCLKTSD